ncbi:MAG TPA: hypothetical protein VGI39_35540 [Polyangiaceae bacterium]
MEKDLSSCMQDLEEPVLAPTPETQAVLGSAITYVGGAIHYGTALVRPE